MARICPTCHGDGHVFDGTGFPNAYGDDAADGEVCRTCSGYCTVEEFDGAGCA